VKASSERRGRREREYLCDCVAKSVGTHIGKYLPRAPIRAGSRAPEIRRDILFSQALGVFLTLID
jgi:hypothetical protein